MYDLIKRLLAFLLPILKSAAIETVADLTYEAAYGKNALKKRRRLSQGEVDNISRHVDQYGKFTDTVGQPKSVLMLAFELTGPSPAIAHQWLLEQLPKPGTYECSDGSHVQLSPGRVVNESEV